MTLAPIESTSRTATSAKVDPQEPAEIASPRSENSEFGHIMSEVLQSTSDRASMSSGQEVAAVSGLQLGWTDAFGENLGTSLGGGFLKAIHLGPHMNVITSEATVPDEQSLEAFARSQGLDETAVQWLMGNSPAVTAPPAVSTLASVLSLESPRPESAPLEGAPLVNAVTATSPDVAAVTGANSAPAPAPALVPAAALVPATAITQPGLTLTAAVNPPPVAPVTTSIADSNIADIKPDGILSSHVLTSAALWAMAQGTEKARAASPAVEEPSEVAKVQINLLASPAPAAFWMLRNPMAATPAKEAVTTTSSMSLSEIDLSQVATPEVLDSLNQALVEGAGLNSAEAATDAPTPLSGHPGHKLELAAATRQEAQNPDASASAPDSGNAQRSENVKNLAEKMGQAVGQRILSEIEKGQWHLKLTLRPATLGHIEVEMRMRSGELDAVFTAPQAVTRELLQEGMSKLKDTLGQMGMDVASMQVGGGQTQQRGGESTPGQMSKSTNDSLNDPQSVLSTAQNPGHRVKMGLDGWDVLV